MVCGIVLCGCGDKEESTVTMTQEEYDELMKNLVQAQSTEEAQKAFDDIEEATGKDTPIDEALFGDSVEQNDFENTSSKDPYFPYTISGEIINAELFDGTVQVYKDILRFDYSMTPEDVYAILEASDRNYLYDLSYKTNQDGTIYGVSAIRPGWTEKNTAPYIFEHFTKETTCQFEDGETQLTFGNNDENYYLTGVDHSGYIDASELLYYSLDEDEYDNTVPDFYYGGGISRYGYDLNGKKLNLDEITNIVKEAGYISKPEGYIQDESMIEQAKGFYFWRDGYLWVLKHNPKLDSYSFVYTMDKLEYVYNYGGVPVAIKFSNSDKIQTISTLGISSVSLHYRGKEALEKIESKLDSLGYSSKYSREIHDKYVSQ